MTLTPIDRGLLEEMFNDKIERMGYVDLLNYKDQQLLDLAERIGLIKYAKEKRLEIEDHRQF